MSSAASSSFAITTAIEKADWHCRGGINDALPETNLKDNVVYKACVDNKDLHGE